METSRQKQVEELFQTALDLSSDDRLRFLDQECKIDHEMRQEIEALLRHYEAANGRFLEQPVMDAAGESTPSVEYPRQIGRYALIRPIGEGGMGIVFEAEQDHPKRTVALKIIRPGMISREVLRRFKHEVDVLGQLQHPGIATIFEAGTARTEFGEHPFFAMELVCGRPLLEHADRYHFGTRQRLELLALVCDAVQYAHRKGVIHRDLKPDNILVEATEPRSHEATEGNVETPHPIRDRRSETERPVAFAPATDGHSTIVPRPSTLRPTPSAPSWLRGSVAPWPSAQPKILDFGVARTIQSDALLLTLRTETGQLVGTLSYMSPEQIAGRPEELDARTDVYSLGVILYELLGRRLPYDLRGRSIPEAGRVIREHEPSRLSSIDILLRGDVETIVAKALEKDRERRYSSAADLAADIRRYLHDEPILARPSGWAYQVGKFAKRNRALVGAILGAFAILVVAVVAISLALVRATRAERLAVQRLAEAQRETTKAGAITGFLQDMLTSIDPGKALGREVTMRDALQQAAAKLQGASLANEPEIEAELRTTLGTTYLALGQYADADPHLRSALEIRRRLDPPGKEKLAESLENMGHLVYAQGDMPGSEALLREAVETARAIHGTEHAAVASMMQSLAGTLRRQGKLAEAEPLYRDSLAIRKSLLGPEHLDVAQGLNSVALLLQDKGEFVEAEQVCREALDLRRRLLGSVHPDVAGSINNLAYLVQMNGDHAEAESLYREALEMRRKLLGEDHPDIAQSLSNLAFSLHYAENFAAAEPYYRQALDLYRKLLGDTHADVSRTMNSLATLLRDRGDFAAAESYFRGALGIRRDVLGPHHLDVAASLGGVGWVLIDQGRFMEAEALLREALAIREAKLGADHWHAALSRSMLGAALAGQARYEEAEPLLLLGYKGMKDAAGASPRRKREALERIVRFYETWERPDSAEPFRALLAP